MKKFMLPAILIFAASNIFSTCQREDQVYPLEPVLTYNAFNVTGNTAEIIIDFTDGDGDIGFDEGQDPDEFNLYLTYQELTDTGWTTIEFDPGYNYRVPNITPQGQYKAIKGSIAIEMTPYFFDPTSDNSHVRFDIQLVDRAGRESNIVQTDEVEMPF